MGVELLIVILIVFMLVAAVIALEADDLLSSVIAVGAAGFALSVIDLLVGAPDLAITQVVVEVIMLVLLIRVVLKRRDEAAAISSDLLRTGLCLLACGVLLAVMFFALGGLTGDDARDGTIPPFGEPVLANSERAAVPPGASKQYLEQTVSETGAVNAVTAVLLDFRAYDTLGEATVIFVSVLGAYALLRRVGRRKEGLAP